MCCRSDSLLLDGKEGSHKPCWYHQNPPHLHFVLLSENGTQHWCTKPVPIQVVKDASTIGLLFTEASSHPIPSFFLLLQPGEYTYVSSLESPPFCICKVYLTIRWYCLNKSTCTDARELDVTTLWASSVPTKRINKQTQGLLWLHSA
jgi:hypothetical protein